MRQSFFWLLITFSSLNLLTACNEQQALNNRNPSLQSSPTQSRLDKVIQRKKLICGVDGKIPGFSFQENEDEYSGFDVDVCRAVAAALFDDPKAVEYRNLEPSERFTAVAFGDVDILSRNSTWTLKRDASFKINFAPILFYDGQGIMVHNDIGVKSFNDLNNKSICVTAGTTTELNLYDDMQERGTKYYLVKFLNNNSTFDAYIQKRCQAISFDRSQLFTRRATLQDASKHTILEEVMSKEPLAPAVAEDDPRWFEVVKWIAYALIEAEELGIDSTNLEEMKKSPSPEIKRFLGLEGDLGQSLGLNRDFTQRIVRDVGNYEEIYERNLGEKSMFKMPRGMNNLWNEEGLLYSPPFR